MKMLFKNVVFILLFCSFFGGNAQSVLGKWKTIDDRSGETKSIVKLYEKDGKIFGDIVHVYAKVKKDTCAQSSSKVTNLTGLTIIRDMKKNGNQYEGGTYTDPVTGKKYMARIWLNADNPNILNVRGYLGILYRTQNWVRME